MDLTWIRIQSESQNFLFYALDKTRIYVSLKSGFEFNLEVLAVG